MTQQQIEKVINQIAQFLEHKAQQGAKTFNFQVNINNGGLTAISAKECYTPKKLDKSNRLRYKLNNN